jgi:DNA-binding transcriptional regulator GbsR (MarR family)
MKTLRESIVNTINELNKLMLKTKDPDEEKKIRKLRKIYFSLLEEVIEQKIKRNTAEFKTALESLEMAYKEAKAAKKDINKIKTAIDKAVSAAKALDKVVKFGFELLT